VTALEAYCRDRIASNPNLLVPWWIMAAWTYDRVGSETLISDALFDEIAVRIDREWETITHWHKPLLDRRMLKSALAIRGQWPLRAMHAAESLLRDGPPSTFHVAAEARPQPQQLALF
jgi:hypothetical protein